ncbi:MAG: hypothetical protein H0V25_06795 [Solirubrobacterales bacterium]|nr:hypothetical protein [Solirubrobacterales bacterium]
MEFRRERVVLETKHHQITGYLHLPREGYLSRFSDFLNRNELRFISLTEAVVIDRSPSGSAATSQRDFIAVGADHVQLAYLDGDGGSDDA